MKTILVMVQTVVVCLSLFSLAQGSSAPECGQPAPSTLQNCPHRLGCGLSRIVFAPCKFYEYMITAANKGGYEGARSYGLGGYLLGSLSGYAVGSVKGLTAMLRQIGQGLGQTVNFWKPAQIHRHISPLYNPEDSFFFDYPADPDPFWFFGSPPPDSPHGL